MKYWQAVIITALLMMQVIGSRYLSPHVIAGGWYRGSRLLLLLITVV